MGPETFTRFYRAIGVPNSTCFGQMCSNATIEMYISMANYTHLGVDCKVYMQVTTTFVFLV